MTLRVSPHSVKTRRKNLAQTCVEGKHTSTKSRAGVLAVDKSALLGAGTIRIARTPGNTEIILQEQVSLQNLSPGLIASLQ